MAERKESIAHGAAKAPASVKAVAYRSARTGRFISHSERVAAARTRVVADRRRGVQTEPWIVELAKKSA